MNNDKNIITLSQECKSIIQICSLKLCQKVLFHVFYSFCTLTIELFTWKKLVTNEGKHHYFIQAKSWQIVQLNVKLEKSQPTCFLQFLYPFIFELIVISIMIKLLNSSLCSNGHLPFAKCMIPAFVRWFSSRNKPLKP